ncbi:hypothetical protein [Streptomyces sp. NPDC002547]
MLRRLQGDVLTRQFDLGPLGIAFAHGDWHMRRCAERVWVKEYANGWVRRVRIDHEGRALVARWIKPKEKTS